MSYYPEVMLVMDWIKPIILGRTTKNIKPLAIEKTKDDTAENVEVLAKFDPGLDQDHFALYNDCGLKANQDTVAKQVSC